ncbi:MAG: trypsin-like peptidase domain-containing protein [Micromonosporaceae bacterium]|nr:trypsin-like peptidase domain-containing protein [Micromonosporaceae bacterium]
MTDMMPRPTFDEAIRPPSRNPRWRRWSVTGLTLLAITAGGGSAGAVTVDRFLDQRAETTTPAAAAAIAARQLDSLADVVDAVSPSIVTVIISGPSASGRAGTTLGSASSLGSGVVLDPDGLILTNQHVIASGGTVSVRFSDGGTATATVLAQDATADLALLRASGVSGLTPATLGSNATVAVGDTVLAFGSPLGLEGTVTAGIISAVDRTIDDTPGIRYLQTDAPINSGNSGGALVNTAGQVIGINVSIATTSQSSGSIGLGFAIPASTVTTVVQRLAADMG